MSEGVASSDAQRTVLSVPEVFFVVAAVQFLLWLLTGALLDGGVACGIYSLMLMGYWIAVGSLRLGRLVGGRSLGRVIAATGWLPPAGCLLWMLGMMRT